MQGLLSGFFPEFPLRFLSGFLQEFIPGFLHSCDFFNNSFRDFPAIPSDVHPGCFQVFLWDVLMEFRVSFKDFSVIFKIFSRDSYFFRTSVMDFFRNSYRTFSHDIFIDFSLVFHRDSSRDSSRISSSIPLPVFSGFYYRFLQGIWAFCRVFLPIFIYGFLYSFREFFWDSFNSFSMNPFWISSWSPSMKEFLSRFLQQTVFSWEFLLNTFRHSSWVLGIGAGIPSGFFQEFFYELLSNFSRDSSWSSFRVPK